MRIAKSILVDPDRNTLYGIAVLTVSYFVFAYSSFFGQLPILVYYALWLPLLLVDYRKAFGNLARYYWILPFAVFACVSVFWSRAPGVTSRAAVEYLTHVICVLIAARTISPRTFTLGSLCGVAVVVLYSLAKGRYFYDPLDGSFSLVGAFADKNQLGLFASLGVFFSFALLWIGHERWPVNLAAILAGIVCLYTLHAADSATSVISVVGAIAAVTAMTLFFSLAPGYRPVLFVGALILGIGLVFLAIESGAVGLLLGAFNKSTTLTGRTYLWARGFAQSHEAPVLGVGYQAYWVQGFPGPEELWAKFYITGRSGFHFHETWIETLVELGYVGAAMLAFILLRSLYGHTRRVLLGINQRSSLLFFGVCILLLIRSFVEVDILAPFQVGSFLLYYVAGLVAAPQAKATAARSVHGHWRPEKAATA